MARADLIEAQRQALLLEMQHIRKDILQQEAWLRVGPLPPKNTTTNPALLLPFSAKPASLLQPCESSLYASVFAVMLFRPGPVLPQAC